MNYTRLGDAGLEVSRLCLGCMPFGQPKSASAWGLDEQQSRAIVIAAIEAGINFFDTANIYGRGASEEVLGRVLADTARREEIVITTKVGGPMRDGPNGKGLSRKAILHEIDASLARLGTDYVDIYQIHRFDTETPVEETIEALHDVVKAGKARYLGASSMYAWQFAKLTHTARAFGMSRFIVMQNHLNLLYREEEREMLPLCAAEGVGVTPWSPLARGRLARETSAETKRSAADAMAGRLYDRAEDADRAILAAVAAMADRRGVPRSQIALAWLLRKSGVTAPVVGATQRQHVDNAVAALDIILIDEEAAQLEAPYTAHELAGF
jgi:aryl-alcohol dehydrogenase-like predicted oxidoreductase